MRRLLEVIAQSLPMAPRQSQNVIRSYFIFQALIDARLKEVLVVESSPVMEGLWR